MEQHDTPARQSDTPGERWTRDRFDFDTILVRRRPHLARLLDEIEQTNRGQVTR